MSLPTPSPRCKSFFEIPHEKCFICGNPLAVFKCYGCSQAFCSRHSVEHRQNLAIELDRLFREGRELDTTVNLRRLESESQVLTEKIKQWEAQSIDKIRKAAADALAQVSNMCSGAGITAQNQLNECHATYMTRLQQAIECNDYHERHLDYWQQFLEDLRLNFARLQGSYFRIETCTVPFISKLIVQGSSSVVTFTKWCYFQRICGAHTDIRRLEVQRQVNEFATMTACSEEVPANCSQGEPRRTETVQARNNADFNSSGAYESYQQRNSYRATEYIQEEEEE